MLTITVDSVEVFDEKSNSILDAEGFTVELEHSLASISKWESKFEKPFLGQDDKTKEETLEYINCMSLGAPLSSAQLSRLGEENIRAINAYINSKMSATWFNEKNQPGRGREIVTSEVIYYWMTALTIPFECDQWHFNRLLTLIKVANQKNAPQKKMGRRDLAAQRRSLNAARQQQYGTRG